MHTNHNRGVKQVEAPPSHTAYALPDAERIVRAVYTLLLLENKRAVLLNGEWECRKVIVKVSFITSSCMFMFWAVYYYDRCTWRMQRR